MHGIAMHCRHHSRCDPGSVLDRWTLKHPRCGPGRSLRDWANIRPALRSTRQAAQTRLATGVASGKTPMGDGTGVAPGKTPMGKGTGVAPIIWQYTNIQNLAYMYIHTYLWGGECCGLTASNAPWLWNASIECATALQLCKIIKQKLQCYAWEMEAEKRNHQNQSSYSFI